MSLLTRLLPVVLGLWLTSAPLPELFRRAKEQFQIGVYAESLKTLDQLDEESQKPGFERDRAALLPGLLFYRAASLAAMGKAAEARDVFQQFLAYQPKTELDPARYPKPVIAAFQDARRAAEKKPAEHSPDHTLAAMYAAFPRPQFPDVETPGEEWVEGPVRYLLTSDERREFVRRADPVTRSEFVANFWKSRDPKPETPENEFREEFAKRVAFADAHFAQDETRGSLTDRGMVFILLGPPTYSGRKPLRTGEDLADASGLSRYGHAEVESAQHGSGNSTDRMARIDKVTGPATKAQDAAFNYIEVWHYLRQSLPREIPFQELELEFVTKVGYGRGVLQRESKALTALERAKTLARRGEARTQS